MDTHKRTLVKALTWRILGTIITGIVALAVTRKLHVAATIGVFDTLIKLAAYYMHERTWLRLNFGKVRPPEYEI